MKKVILTLLALCPTIAVSSNVMDVAKENGYTAFYNEVKESGLLEHAIKPTGEQGSMAPFTVFVPTNEAMKSLSEVNQKTVKDVIKFHVVPGQEYASPEDFPTDGIPTVGQQMIMVSGDNNTTLNIDESETQVHISSDDDGKALSFEADNGVIYIIDGVLKPFEEESNDDQETQESDTDDESEQESENDSDDQSSDEEVEEDEE